MTKQFTASNGIIVTIDNRGYLIAKGGIDDRTTHATGGAHFGVQALREYFQHERDQELGRWRDPENPDIVVYPMGGGTDELWILNEKEPSEYETWTREEVDRGVFPMVFGYDSAKRYFDAHPESKPWHEAQLGEVWLVTFDSGETTPLLVSKRVNLPPLFSNAHGHRWALDSSEITHAEKIYPREENE